MLTRLSMYHLKLLGGADIHGPQGPLAGRVVQKRQLALLAWLALQDGRRATRDKIVAVFWPDTSSERARRSLSDAVYTIRRELGEDAIVGAGDALALGPTIDSDVADLRALLAEGRNEEAVRAYTGVLLDGFHFESVEFEHWLETERFALIRACAQAAETAAAALQSEGNPAAAELWRFAFRMEPHNSRVAHALAMTLDAFGDRAGALEAIARHAAYLEGHYEVGLPPELVEYRNELQREQPPDPSRESRPYAATGVIPERPIPPEIWSDEPHGAAEAEPGPGRRPIVATAAVVLLAVVAATIAWTADRAARQDSIDPDLVAILPFRTAGAESSLAYLQEGMVDLLDARLTGDGGTLRAAPPSDVIAAWRRVASNGQSEISQEVAFELAASLGAGLLLTGSAVGGPDRMSIQARLVDIRNGEAVGHASVTGAEPELSSIVEDVVAQLLSRKAGVEERNVAFLTSARHEALFAYLSAQSARRRGEYVDALSEYTRAIDLDSTFALAALGIVDLAGWIGGTSALAGRARAIRSRHADRLSERDRPLESDPAILPTVRYALDRIENGLLRWPDHARFWYQRGDHHMHLGGVIDPEGSPGLARSSFERAIELDPDYAEPVHHLVTVLATEGDTAAVRSLAGSRLARTAAGSVADYLRWIAVHSLADPSFGVAPLEAMDTDATLRWIGIVAQDYGFAMADGIEAVRIRIGRPGTERQRLERLQGALAYALNGGRPEAARGFNEAIAAVTGNADYGRRLAILAARFGGGDPEAAERAAAELDASTAVAEVADLNACILTLWRLATDPDVVPRPRTLTDSEALSPDPRVHADSRRLCTLVRDAEWLERIGGREWLDAIDRLDRFLDMGPITGLVDEGQREYAHVALGMLLDRAGLPERALVALNRRSRYNGWQPYLARLLAEQGRIALEVGDTALAIRSWTHYLDFRGEPESTAVPDVDRIRASLAGLTPVDPTGS